MKLQFKYIICESYKGKKVKVYLKNPKYGYEEVGIVSDTTPCSMVETIYEILRKLGYRVYYSKGETYCLIKYKEKPILTREYIVRHSKSEKEYLPLPPVEGIRGIPYYYVYDFSDRIDYYINLFLKHALENIKKVKKVEKEKGHYFEINI